MRLLLVFAKEPAPGKAKTRLAQSVGPDRAAALAGAFLDDTLEHAAAGAALAEASLGILHDPCDEATHDAFQARAERLGVRVTLAGQLAHESLGVRLESGFRRALESYDEVCAIGTDSPDLAPEDYAGAFAALGGSSAVLGPATDGGYWLVGVSRRAGPDVSRAFLDPIAWSTATARRDTEAAFVKRRVAVRLLEEREDVDDLPALLRLIERLRAQPRRAFRTATVLGVQAGGEAPRLDNL
jgi:rSAM/selenodomain-associated transferase 1